MSDFQHCESCHTEFVAGISACTDCGGPLAPGPLPEQPAKAHQATVTGEDEYHYNRLLARLPGAQADVVAKVLNLAGIPCLLECEDIRRLCLPDYDHDHGEPLAVTLPVSIYVDAECEREAKDLLDSMWTDVIGDQWREEPQVEDAEEGVETEAQLDRVQTESSNLPELRTESTTWRAIAIIAAGLFVLLMLLNR